MKTAFSKARSGPETLGLLSFDVVYESDNQVLPAMLAESSRQTQSLYSDRTPGGHCDYRDTSKPDLTRFGDIQTKGARDVLPG
jgi:hypothetical protein